jgi:hypothetical protein
LVKAQLDLEYIPGEVKLGVIDKKSGLTWASGGRFADSNLVQFSLNGQVTVYQNGVIEATTQVREADGQFYLKSNNKSISTLTPAEWSLTEQQGRMAEAFLNKTPMSNSKFYEGTSGGVDFTFRPPLKAGDKWNGFPTKPKP